MFYKKSHTKTNNSRDTLNILIALESQLPISHKQIHYVPITNDSLSNTKNEPRYYPSVIEMVCKHL